jgi:histone acetyltransferase 1
VVWIGGYPKANSTPVYPQLHYASGSLAQFLSIQYSARAPASNVDDVEGTLFKFIPSGILYWLPQGGRSAPTDAHAISDYVKGEASFLKRVEQDATVFRPLGEKVSSIVRRASSAKGKGKPKETDIVNEGDEDAVVYEAYHVCAFSLESGRSATHSSAR